MADKISSLRRSENMRRIRNRDMTPEIAVRKKAHRLGYRFRLHRKDLPGKPDLVFPKKRVVIFVHGCFWHQHSDPNCPISRKPRSNTEYWDKKLKRNVERDSENMVKLQEYGWSPYIIWECETKSAWLERKITEILG